MRITRETDNNSEKSDCWVAIIRMLEYVWDGIWQVIYVGLRGQYYERYLENGLRNSLWRTKNSTVWIKDCNSLNASDCISNKYIFQRYNIFQNVVPSVTWNEYFSQLIYSVMVGTKASIGFIIESTIGQDPEPFPSFSHPHKLHFLSPSLENKYEHKNSAFFCTAEIKLWPKCTNFGKSLILLA